MPTRKDFPKKYFTDNPLEGDPVDAYRRIQWGNEPTDILSIDAPEPLVALGNAAQLVLGDRRLEFEEGEAFIAIGVESNRVYILPKGTTEVPEDGYESQGEVRQTDYVSGKGGEEAYYFHEHEGPFPDCLLHPSGVIVLEPIETEDCRRRP
jgi:hypothetical protein